jgi:hypothetical protein
VNHGIGMVTSEWGPRPANRMLDAPTLGADLSQGARFQAIARSFTTGFKPGLGELPASLLAIRVVGCPDCLWPRHTDLPCISSARQGDHLANPVNSVHSHAIARRYHYSKIATFDNKAHSFVGTVQYSFLRKRQTW